MTKTACLHILAKHLHLFTHTRSHLHNLAMIVLWTASMYLYMEKKCYWLTAVPATFMSAVSMTYFFSAPECLHLSTAIAYPAGIILAIAFLGFFLFVIHTRNPKPDYSTLEANKIKK